METNAILDFSDLAEPTKFKFNGKTWSIVPITKKVANALFALSTAMSSEEEKKTDNNETGELFPENVKKEKSSEDFLLFQHEYIATVVVDENNVAITKDELETWPIKVSRKVMVLINEQIHKIGDEDEEKK